MKTLAYIVILTASFSSFQSFASADDDEHMTVDGPDLSGLPGTLGMLTGWVGAAGSGVPASLEKAAVQYAVKKSLKQKENRAKNQKKAEQESEYDDATRDSTATQATKEIGQTVREAIKSGGGNLFFSQKEYYPNGALKSETTLKSCDPAGVLNPKNPCTQMKIEQFVDPIDNETKWSFTIAVVEAKYIPTHIEADAEGYALVTVDNQAFTLVFQTVEDLEYQLATVGKAK